MQYDLANSRLAQILKARDENQEQWERVHSLEDDLRVKRTYVEAKSKSHNESINRQKEVH